MVRSLRLYVRMDREEMDFIKNKSSKYGLSISEFVRFMCVQRIKRYMHKVRRGKRA